MELKKTEKNGDFTIRNIVMSSLEDPRNQRGQSDYLIVDTRAFDVDESKVMNNVRAIALDVMRNRFQSRLKTVEVVGQSFHHIFLFREPGKS